MSKLYTIILLTSCVSLVAMEDNEDGSLAKHSMAIVGGGKKMKTIANAKSSRDIDDRWTSTVSMEEEFSSSSSDEDMKSMSEGALAAYAKYKNNKRKLNLKKFEIIHTASLNEKKVAMKAELKEKEVAMKAELKKKELELHERDIIIREQIQRENSMGYVEYFKEHPFQSLMSLIMGTSNTINAISTINRTVNSLTTPSVTTPSVEQTVTVNNFSNNPLIAAMFNGKRNQNEAGFSFDLSSSANKKD